MYLSAFLFNIVIAYHDDYKLKNKYT